MGPSENMNVCCVFFFFKALVMILEVGKKFIIKKQNEKTKKELCLMSICFLYFWSSTSSSYLFITLLYIYIYKVP